MKESVTLLLIQVDKPFDEYIKGLSKHAKKDWAYVQKHNQDLVYEKIPFDTDLVREFMALWERQLIRGKNVTWAFPVETVENWAQEGQILLFQAKTQDGEALAVHFVRLRANYVECHPPMYDKKHSKRYLAKYMWFNLIKYAMDNKLPHLDMGGGPSSWREHIRRKAEFPNPQYKWIYVPEDVKNNPDSQPNYQIDEGCLRELD